MHEPGSSRQPTLDLNDGAVEIENARHAENLTEPASEASYVGAVANSRERGPDAGAGDEVADADEAARRRTEAFRRRFAKVWREVTERRVAEQGRELEAPSPLPNGTRLC